MPLLAGGVSAWTFSAPSHVISSPGIEESSAKIVALSATDFVMVFVSKFPAMGATPAHDDVYAIPSADGGLSWEAKTRVYGDAAAGVLARTPDVACNSTGTLFVVWSDDRTGIHRVYFSISADGGRHFATPMLVTASATGNQTSPSIAVAGDVIYIAWAEYVPGKDPDIFIARSLDSGSSFQAPVRVDESGSASAIQEYPDVCAQGSNVLVAWADLRADTLPDVYCAFSNDLAASFVREKKVSDGPPGSEQNRPSAQFTPDGRIVIAWQDHRTGDYDIRTSHSHDNAVTFSSSIVAGGGPLNSVQSNPSLACDYRGKTYLVYEDYRAPQYTKIMFCNSTDLNSFTAPVRVDAADPAAVNVTQRSPDVACSENGTILVAYDANLTASEYDLFFTRMFSPNVPPSVTIAAPIDGSTVPTGEFVVSGTVSDPDAFDPLHPTALTMQYSLVQGTDVIVDWTAFATSSLPNWQFTLNSSHYENGDYDVQVRASDSIAFSTVQSVDIVIDNAAPQMIDLVLSNDDMWFDVPVPVVGDLVNVSVLVSNLGNAPAHLVSTRFFLDSVEMGQVNLTIVPAGESRLAKLPWIATLGTHNISVMVDANASIAETNESNNLAWKQITVVAQPVLSPDLEISAGNITFKPDTIYEGADVNVSVVVYNGGSAPVANAAVSFHLGGTYSNLSVTIPAGTAASLYAIWPSVSAGSHTVTVTADPMHLLGETNYSNNQASASFSALPNVLNRPDLKPNTGIQLSPAPPSLTDGNMTIVSVTVLNDGNAAASDVDVRFQMGSTTIGVRRIASLAAGAAEEVSAQWLATTGPHTASVQVDFDHNITETDEGNNNVSREFSVRPRAFYIPDLGIQEGGLALYPSQVKVDVACEIVVIVTNLGNDTVGSAEMKIMLDGSQLGNTFYISNLNPGDSRNLSLLWMPTYGTHTITATVDPTNAVHEANESNNNATVSLDLGSAPIDMGNLVLPILGVLSIVVLAAGVIAYSRARKRRRQK